MTDYASGAVPGWAAQAWVIWPVFAVLVAVGIGLLLWGRHLDTAAGPPARPAPVSRLAQGRQASLRPPHVQRVRGREGELAVLAGMLGRPQGRFAVLCAVGGTGKTTVAAQLAAQAEAAGGRVFWVRWRDGAELAQQMVQVAPACGLPEAELEAARAGQASLPDVVWRQLGRVRKWLLVVDNADEPQEIGPAGVPVADYRGGIRPDGRGLLVVTSRDGSEQTWGPCARLLPLGPLPARPAGQVLLDAAPAAGTAEQARELAARLGGLPLALHAAGTCLAGPTSRYRTFAAYRDALEMEPGFLWGAAHPSASPPQVARAVMRHTWEVSLDQLAGEGNALAHPVLRLLALLAQAPVPLSLITPDLLSVVTGHDVTAVALEAAFAGLHRYGLLGLPHSPGSTGPASGSGEGAQVAASPDPRDQRCRPHGRDLRSRRVAPNPCGAADHGRARGRAARARWLARGRALAPHLPLLLDHADPRTAPHHRTTLNDWRRSCRRPRFRCGAPAARTGPRRRDPHAGPRAPRYLDQPQ
ncbi:hypothetical protein [Streptomyces vinaceus]|uniref:hypothetical protein n=1 Tax=Streptomyces vinaceus TaxID=1960 RepID=UPI001E4569BD|nr:hypothetical protein [Streptomyces vinaceus]